MSSATIARSLTFLSYVERVVKSRLIDHFTSNKLLNPHQSAFFKHHSAVIALHLRSSHQCNRITKTYHAFAFLISAAFDIVDHNILISRLSSWFGIHGSVLSWFKSYLSSRSFRVKCNNNLSFFYTSSCGVLQGSVNGPLLFVVYTTPLSTLISSLSLDHHLYANDTQLFSFHPLNFNSSIFHLKNALHR